MYLWRTHLKINKRRYASLIVKQIVEKFPLFSNEHIFSVFIDFAIRHKIRKINYSQLYKFELAGFMPLICIVCSRIASCCFPLPHSAFYYLTLVGYLFSQLCTFNCVKHESNQSSSQFKRRKNKRQLPSFWILELSLIRSISYEPECEWKARLLQAFSA